MSVAKDLRSDRDDLTPTRPSAGTAVILNANAKRVTPRVRRLVEASAGDADVFFTEDLEQAQFVSHRVADRGYKLVVTGGGDGTVTNTIDQVVRRIEDTRGAEQVPYPQFAVLKLGTGNAVADFLQARHFKQDLAELSQAQVKPVDLIQLDDGRRVPFAGFGWDAHILNNYDQLKEAAQKNRVTRALFKSVLGYLIAGLGKSVPEFLIQRPQWQCRVINAGGMALQLDTDGNVVKRFAPGEVVYEGGVRMACFGTTPYFGFKFKIMPFADRTPGMFHLRLINMPPLAAVAQLRSAWKGKMRHRNLTDLQMTACRIEFDDKAPFQIAGDAEGYRDSIELKVNEQPLECLHFAA
ncbi:MAG: diacylglycerol/lipid kinase family protein [Bradymonadia bacterium]